MPFWPWYMAACVGLMVYGYRRGGVAIPALILGGLVGMRAIMWGFDPALREVSAHILWLCVAILLMYKGAWVPGALCLLSGVTYPTLLVLGVRIEYLGMSPIIADAFLIAAMLAGWLGMAQYSNSGANRARMAGDGQGFAVGLAAYQVRAGKANRGGAEMKAGR